MNVRDTHTHSAADGVVGYCIRVVPYFNSIYQTRFIECQSLSGLYRKAGGIKKSKKKYINGGENLSSVNLESGLFLYCCAADSARKLPVRVSIINFSPSVSSLRAVLYYCVMCPLSLSLFVRVAANDNNNSNGNDNASALKKFSPLREGGRGTSRRIQK